MHHKIYFTLISMLLLGSVGGSVKTSPWVHAARPRRVRRVRHVSVRRFRTRVRRSRVRRRKVYRFRQRPRKLKRWTITRIPTGVYPKDLLYYTQNGKIGYTRYYLSRPSYHTDMSKGYVNSVVKNEYREINRARQRIHERPLNKNYTLCKLANWRAQQAKKQFTHYDQNGQPLAWLDAVKMRLGSYQNNRKNIGENMFYVGKLSQVQTNSGVAGYYFKEPGAMAGDNVFDSLNNDAASQWAHGENIMMPQHRYVGIGTYYRKSNQTLYVLVEFSSKRPVVHKTLK